MKLRFLIVVAVLMAQCCAIGWLIVRYERVVQKGMEVRFKCQAYDPYDPLRGRYLRMTVSEATTNLPSSVTNRYEFHNKFVVRIEPSTNGLWRVSEAAFEPTGDGVWVKPRSSSIDYRLPWSAQGKGEKWSAFEKRREASGLVVSVAFPNQLFVNEKFAPAAEKLLREKTHDAVAVYRVLNGDIVLTGIEIGGESILEKVKEAK